MKKSLARAELIKDATKKILTELKKNCETLEPVR
jgi:hypothetical protein